MSADRASELLRQLTERIRLMARSPPDPVPAGGDAADAFAEAMGALDELARRSAAPRFDLEQLRHANRLVTVGALTAGMAHELGTPLGVVLARAQMIDADDVDLAEARKDAQAIVAQVRRMSQMCRDVLEYARPKAPSQGRVDLAVLVRQTLNLLVPDARKRNTVLAMAPDTPASFVLGDAAQLMQIVTNLVLNATQAMTAAGTVTVRIDQRRVAPPSSNDAAERDFVCLQVTDRGTGIRSADLPRIFETFFTTKNAGEATGLGLAVSDRIAREHGGWIGVVTAEGEGSCFTLYLPPHASVVVAPSPS